MLYVAHTRELADRTYALIWRFRSRGFYTTRQVAASLQHLGKQKAVQCDYRCMVNDYMENRF
jgi:hypothetical protein